MIFVHDLYLFYVNGQKNARRKNFLFTCCILDVHNKFLITIGFRYDAVTRRPTSWYAKNFNVDFITLSKVSRLSLCAFQGF